AGFEAIMLPAEQQVAAVKALIASRKPRALIVDTRSDVTRSDIANFTTMLKPVAVVDDGSDRRLAATHAYYAPVPQVQALSWAGSHCEVRSGWEWALTGMDVADVPSRPVSHAEAPCVLVTMGGSDPCEFTQLALRALSRIAVPFRARFILGPGFRNA